MADFPGKRCPTLMRVNSTGRFALLLFGLAVVLAIHGCAKPFDRPLQDSIVRSVADRGDELFAMTANAHGAENIESLENYNVALSGQWRWLIKKIQPLVSDFRYRVDSEERLFVGKGIYSARYSGPAGTKVVIKTPESIRVFYNGMESFDDNVLQSTALTADAFYLFLLGPLALLDKTTNFIQLPDKRENGRSYYRIYTQLRPGFGNSAQDELILWIDQQTGLTWRVHITLEGYETTRGAHADVTYLDYTSRSGFVFPAVFNERVRGPIAIHAHDWALGGVDINRDYKFEELNLGEWAGAARVPARPIVD